MSYTFLLGILVVGISVGLRNLFPQKYQTMIIIILISTISILLTFIPLVQKLDTNFPLGMYLIYIFCIAVGSMVNLEKILNIQLNLLIYVIIAVFGSLFLHSFLCKIFSIDADTFIITSVANICSPPFVQVIAETIHNKQVILSGITKEASTILYKNREYLKHQFFISENWCGSIYASPSILGTKSGGSIAAAWAALVSQGEKGYLDNAKKIMKITSKIQSGIKTIPDLDIVGDPPTGIFSFYSLNPNINIFAIGDLLQKKGWHIDRLQKPQALHLMITPHHEKIINKFLKDLQYAYQTVKENPNLAYEGNAAIYGMISNIPLRNLVRKNILKMMEDMYGHNNKLPEIEKNTENNQFMQKLMKWYLKFINKFKQ